MNVLGIIPARGGSKRVLNKNTRDLAGKPLISYTIESALKSNRIDRLIVSTDDREIANVADKYGVEVPFLRPDHLAKDDTPDQPVFQHALKMLKKQDGYEPDIVLNLRPTTPLKTSYTIDKVIKKIKEKNADIVRTMSPVEGVNHPYWMYKRSNDGQATSFMMEVNIDIYYQSQLLPKVFRINGVVDAYSYLTVMNGNILRGENMYSIITPDEESVDIDTEFDFTICEALINNVRNKKINDKQKSKPYENKNN